MALNFEDDIDNEQEGMIGKILSVARANHEIANQRFDKNQAGIKDAHAKIEKIQEMQEEFGKKMEQLEEKLTQNQTQAIKDHESRLIEAFTKLMDEKLDQKQTK